MALTTIVPIEEQQKKWYLLWKPIIEKCQKCTNASEIHLLQVLSNNEATFTWKTLKHLTEYALNNCEKASTIFSRISNKIKTDKDNQNEIIQEMFSEIRAIPCLVMLGFKNLIYQRSDSLDFRGSIDGMLKNIEVTYIGGQSFKTQTKSEKLSKPNKLPIYELKPRKLINKLKSIYQEKEEQFVKHHNQNESILLILTNLLEADQFWFEDQPYEGKHPIKAFVDNCSIPTIVLAPGLIPYTSKQLESILLPFDRNKYLELGYGIKIHEEQQQEIKRKLEKMFWEGYNS